MELKQYFDAIKKWWWLLVASTLVATISGYIGVSRMPRIYQATTTIMVGQSLQSANPNSQDMYISQQLAQTYREMVTRQPILSGAAGMLGLPYMPSPEDVNAWLVAGTNLMGIAVRDTDPERARALADAIVQQLILTTPNEIAEDQERQEFVRTQLRQLEANIQATEEEIVAENAKLAAANSARAIQQYQTNIAAMQEKLTAYQATYGSLLGSVEGRSNFISVFEPASTPTRPISPNVMQTVLMAAAIGLALAVGGALLIEFLDDTVKMPEDVKRAAGLPTLGSIARLENGEAASNLVAVHEPLSLVTEAFRTLRTNIRVSSVDKPLQMLVITSAQPAEGKTTLAANLGVVMAQAGNRVVLVDADLRRSTLHKKFEVPNREGLTNALLEEEPVPDDWLRETEVENLRVLTSGPLPPNPSELLGSQKMRRLIERLKDEADIILFDTPPILLVTDAAVLAMEADGVLLVAESGRTRRAAVQQSAQRLRQLGANIVGVVLNFVPAQHPKGYYYYRYYQGQDGKQGGAAPNAEPRTIRPGQRWKEFAGGILDAVANRWPLGGRQSPPPQPAPLHDEQE
jgi:succinoglycan biosynthesis transport protein ExoP